MSRIDDVRGELSGRLDDVAQKHWGALGEKAFKRAEDFKKALEEDATAFLEKTEEDLNRWADLADEGKLMPDELEFLLMGKRDLAEMHGLKQAGLALVQVQKMKAVVIQSVIAGVFDMLLGSEEGA